MKWSMVMRFLSRQLTRSVGVSLLGGLCTLAVPRAAVAGYDFDEKGNAFATGQAIVAFKPGTTLITARSVLARSGADPNTIRFVDHQSALVKFDERKDVLSFCQQMGMTSWTTGASPNYMHRGYGAPNDPYYSLQWGLKGGTAVTTPTVGADFQNARGYVVNTVGSGVKVGVIDTGIDLGHPELLELPNGPRTRNVGGLYGAMTFVNAIPSGPASFPPYVFGVGAPNDDNGHGTHVAGVIAARTDNGLGVASGAPASIIYPIKAANRLNVLMDDDIARAIQFAATNGCRVINMSFGGPATGFVVTNAIRFAMIQTVDRTVIPNVTFKGCVCVAAMGNDGASVINYPAVLPGVAAVGAHGPTGLRPAYSTFGPWITLAAPGGDGGTAAGGLADNAGQIFSTYPTYNVASGPPILPAQKPNYTNYSYMSGTSMAAPHVAAAAALLLQKKPYLSAAQVLAQLCLFSTHVTTNSIVVGRNGATIQIPDTAFTSAAGYGLLNANSLLLAQQPPIGRATVIPHVFPFSPRNHFIYPTGAPIPLTNGAYALTGLETVDVVRASATNTFRVIVVDDKGERIPTAQVTARFRLLSWIGSPLGYPTSNVVDTAMLDTGTTAQDDLLPSDCVYGCRISFPGSFSNCLYELRYLVTAPGMNANTSRVVNIQVR